MPPTLVYTHAACLNHQPGPHHPESPERLKTVLQTLRAPEFAALEWRDAPMGTLEQVQLIHNQDFIDEVAEIAPQHGYMPLDGGDTVMSPGSWEAVMRCVGAACAGVDAVLNDDARNVFCATRPCGHHAEPGKAMGFCIFNQAAIAAAYAHDVHKLERVAVVDFDVHHGNGTQAAFYDRPELFYASSHQSPLYPGTGKSAETGVSHNILNVPLPPGCDSDLFRSRIEADMRPAVREFRPAVTIVDAVTNLLTVGTQHDVRAMLMRVIDHFKVSGMTGLFSSLTSADSSYEDTEVGISSLMDTWIVLTIDEIERQRRRSIRILKSRGMAHSNRVHDFALTDNGLRLTDGGE